MAHENLVQRVTPDEIRSRVFAGGEAVYQGGIAVGTIGAGGLIAAFGVADTFRVGAIGSVVACAILVATVAAIAKSSPRAPGGRRGGVLPPPSTSTASPSQSRDHIRNRDVMRSSIGQWW